VNGDDIPHTVVAQDKSFKSRTLGRTTSCRRHSCARFGLLRPIAAAIRSPGCSRSCATAPSAGRCRAGHPRALPGETKRNRGGTGHDRQAS
jgi:hypothetical protein